MASMESIRENECREATAFDRVADTLMAGSLRMSPETFYRYRQASIGRPLMDGYPDQMFVHLHALLRCPLNGLHILDLGSGDGVWSAVLADQGAKVVGIEISARQVAIARERMVSNALTWDARVGSAYRLKEYFEPASFDVVFGQGVLHHLTVDLPALANGIAFVLKPGGIAIFVEPYIGSSLLRTLRVALSSIIPLDQESPDERPLTDKDIQILSQTMKLRIREHGDVFTKFIRRFGGDTSCIRYLDKTLLRIPGLSRLSTLICLAWQRI